jgi:hypothetical protein
VDAAEVEAEIRQATSDGAANDRAARAALARRDTRERVEMLLRERKTVDRLLALATGETAEPSSDAEASTSPAQEHSHA